MSNLDDAIIDLQGQVAVSRASSRSGDMSIKELCKKVSDPVLLIVALRIRKIVCETVNRGDAREGKLVSKTALGYTQDAFKDVIDLLESDVFTEQFTINERTQGPKDKKFKVAWDSQARNFRYVECRD